MGRVPYTSARRGAIALAASFLWTLAAVDAVQAQNCTGSLPLFSPESLSVVFDSDGAPVGNRLRWPGIARSDATCVTTSFDAGSTLQARLAPQVTGLYANRFDRSFRFSLVGSGVVGDTSVDQLFLTMLNDHPSRAAGSRTGRVNLSGRGGIFRVDPNGTGDATQINEGLPGHIDLIEVTGLARDQQSGRLFAAMRSLPLVYSDDGGQTWVEPVYRVRPPFRSEILSMRVSPNDPNLLFMNVVREGLWRSDDGGVTWARSAAVDAIAGGAAAVDVSVAKYLRVVPQGGDPDDPNDRVNRLYVHVAGAGLYFSDDDGLTFARITGLTRPSLVLLGGDQVVDCSVTTGLSLANTPVRDLIVSPTQPEKIYLALKDWGVYQGDTVSGHSVWEARNEGIVLCRLNLERPLGERREVRRLVALASPDGTEDFLVAVTDNPPAPADVGSDERSNTTVLLSQDSGRSWSLAPLRAVLDPEVGEEPLRITALVADPRPNRPRGVIAATQRSGLWELNIEPQEGSWVKLAQQPYTPRTTSLLAMPDGSLIVGTSGAGVYRPGLVVDLDRLAALNLAADVEPGIGLSLTLGGGGQLNSGEGFTVLGQTFQSYAVWRAREIDLRTGEPDWQLIGLYDLTNPEFCSLNSCDEPDLVQVVGCFADKRANCFAPPTSNEDGAEWEFFDRDVYNGFTYYYSVTTLDYGNTATTSPTNFNGDFSFSPRSAAESDPAALPFVGLRDGQNFNLETFQVNVSTTADLRNVYVVPNPLVRQAGWDVGDASSVRFVNVTPTAKVQIFTMAGDLVHELDNVVFGGEERGNIQWDTRNAEGELVASGVYIYRVTDDDGNEVVDRFTVIR